MKRIKNKRLFVLILAILLALTGITFYGGPITYGFLGVVLLIPPVMFLYILCVIVSLKIYQKPDGRNMVSGSPSDFYITLQNESWFSFSSLRIIFYSSFSTIMGLEDNVIYELPPHSSIQRKTQLLCRYRGEYKVGIKKIVVQDFLGIFSFTYNIKEPLTVIVAPAVIRLDELHKIKQDTDADREKLTDRVRPDIPVREYIAGDDIRYLNWKASAVMQKLMLREKTGEEKNKIAILMDAKRYGSTTEEYLPPENKVIESVLALTLYYMEKGIPVDVICRTEHNLCIAVESAGDFEELYHQMCGYRFREDTDTRKMLAEIATDGTLGGYRQILPVMQRWSTEYEELFMQANYERTPYQLILIEKRISTGTSENEKTGHGTGSGDMGTNGIVLIDSEDLLEEVL